MNIEELMSQRQSCRSFDPTFTLSKDKLNEIISLALLSPSARNRQPYQLYVTTQGASKTAVADACMEMGANAYVKDASAFVVIALKPKTVVERVSQLVKVSDFRPIDAGIFTANLVNIAKDKGVDSLIVGWLNEKKLRQVCSTAVGEEVCLVIALGKQTEGYELRSKTRKGVDEKVKYLD